MDLSNQYQAPLLQPEPVLSNNELEALRSRYQILFIKGIFGDVLPKSLDNYFFEQISFPNENEIDNMRLESDTGFGTQKTPKSNVGPIENSILQFNEQSPDKKVIIVTHSKGALDFLEMLISGEPEVQQKVAGWISLNAPFLGTPLANWATSNIFYRFIGNSLLKKLFKGDKETFNILRTDVCQQYLVDHADNIEVLGHSIGILNFVSYITWADRSIFMAQSILINTFARQNNDGVVPLESGLLKLNHDPNYPFICTEHVDHIATVLHLKPETSGAKALREKKFTVFLKLWLDNNLV